MKYIATGNSPHMKKGLEFELTEEMAKILIKKGAIEDPNKKKAPSKAKKEQKKESK